MPSKNGQGEAVDVKRLVKFLALFAWRFMISAESHRPLNILVFPVDSVLHVYIPERTISAIFS